MGKFELVGNRELLGAYELIGNLLTDHRTGASPASVAQYMRNASFGARPGMQAQAQQQANSYINQRVAESSHVLVDQQPSKSRRHYIPVNSTGTIAAAASQACTSQSQVLAFRPERIVVPASIAPDFTIDSIFVGIKPQFVQIGSIAAETFTQDARDVDMHMDTVNNTQNFTMNVTNQSGAARQFRATVFGTTADN